MSFALVMPMTPTEIVSLLDVADRAARLHEQPGSTETLRQGLRALMAYVGDALHRNADEAPNPCAKCAEDEEVEAALLPIYVALDAEPPDFAAAHTKLASVQERWPNHPLVVRAATHLSLERDVWQAET